VGEREPRAGFAPKWVVRAELGDDGRIVRLYTVLASGKLSGVA